jgi:hypothetical protein
MAQLDCIIAYRCGSLMPGSSWLEDLPKRKLLVVYWVNFTASRCKSLESYVQLLNARYLKVQVMC